jgi:hypothetical protein
MKFLAAPLFFATFVALALGYSAAATAEPPTPVCPKNTVTIGNQGQVINVPQQSQVCDNDPMNDGLLGDLPVLGNLPGLGGIL